ncbi:MAG: hypothetical protein GW849_07150 [Flavobacteriia bacterium]|nr:hypothetical protein [Flavobacteriia bacterium]
MRKLVLVLFLLAIVKMEAQQNLGIEKSDSRRGFFVSLSGGLTSPTGNYKTYSDSVTNADGQILFGATEKINGKSQFNLDAGYRFGAFGLGFSIGYFSHELSDLTFQSDLFNADFPLLKNVGSIDGTYYGTGPDYTYSFGKFSTTASARIGLMNFSTDTFTGSYNGSDTDAPIEIIRTEFASDGKTSLGYSSVGLKLSYDISKQLSLFTKTDYFITLSDGLKVTDNGVVLNDINKDQLITAADFDFAGPGLERFENERFTKPKMVNVGFGLTYNFDAPKTRVRNGPKQTGKEIKVAKSVDSHSKMPPRDIDKPFLMQKGTVVFTNPSKKDNKRQQKIIAILPANNSSFKSVDDIENFTWELVGDKIPNPHYIIEITKIGSNRQAQRVYVGTSSDTKIAAKKVAKFKAGKALADTVKRKGNVDDGSNEEQAGDGQYSWKVTETSTGISSAPSFFSVSNCEFDLQITNETIECLGYEGENRKYKICFSSTYQSSTGNLTFANSGSGLFVYHPINNSLNPTNISPSLVTQIGATTSTVSYCFEVTVSASVTSIGFGLQGDDLDLSPVTCQPGASLMFDELPDCICDECEDTELSFDNFNISLNGTSGNQFNFNGNINVNVPIYGIEFQIQSFSYSANPSACSEGISNLEESGMFLMPGTTINGSTSLQLANETASGSASSNDNATKNIKYSSNTALTGAIPVNLTIGLPGPISGLDPSCCVIEYNVCIKVKIFYDDGSCKSCVFTHCFNFNNQ